MPVTSWSLTAADNNAAPPNGWPEGMAPSAVNNTARQGMADIVREFQVNAVKVLASVSGTNTITGSMTPDLASYSAGMLVVFTPANNNTGAATLNIDSLGALDIQKADGDALVSGDLVAGIPAVLALDSGADDWILLNPMTLSGVGLSLSGNATVGGTLGVTGASTLASVGVTGNATVGGTLGVTGLTTVAAFTATGALTTGTAANSVGYLGMPRRTSSYDYGNCSAISAGLTIDTGLTAGSVISFYNDSASSVTLTQGSGLTLRLAGTTTTGNRTLAARGLATAWANSTTEYIISGTGLS